MKILIAIGLFIVFMGLFTNGHIGYDYSTKTWNIAIRTN